MEHDSALRIFDGAVAIITGGASGIGRALSEALGRRGASVVLADRQAALVQEVAAGIQEKGRSSVRGRTGCHRFRRSRPTRPGDGPRPGSAGLYVQQCRHCDWG